MKKKPLTPTARLAAIAKIIDDMPTKDGMFCTKHYIVDQTHIHRIYSLAKGAKRAKRK